MESSHLVFEPFIHMCGVSLRLVRVLGPVLNINEGPIPFLYLRLRTPRLP